jgi:hypothetical protein
VFTWIKDKSLYCSVRENRWELQAIEKLGHALSLNMRCEVIHDGEIFPNHGACAGGLHFFWHTYKQKMCDYLIYLQMNYREYQIYSSQKVSSNHSRRSQTSSSMVVLRICERVERALPCMQWIGHVSILPAPATAVHVITRHTPYPRRAGKNVAVL